MLQHPPPPTPPRRFAEGGEKRGPPRVPDRRSRWARLSGTTNPMTSPSIQMSNSRYTSAFSRREAPEVCVSLSPEITREQGIPDARCTRGPVCKGWKRKSHTSIQGSGGDPTFPAQWLYGLYRALPGESGFPASVALRKPTRRPGWAFAPSERLDANH